MAFRKVRKKLYYLFNEIYISKKESKSEQMDSSRTQNMAFMLTLILEIHSTKMHSGQFPNSKMAFILILILKIHSTKMHSTKKTVSQVFAFYLILCPVA